MHTNLFLYLQAIDIAVEISLQADKNTAQNQNK